MTDREGAQPEAAPDTITARRSADQECPECGRTTVAVFTVTGHLGGQERTLGGWAWCRSCTATPHPTLTEARRD